MTKKDKPDLSKYSVHDATHYLQCRHQICSNGWDYEMPCIPLGRTKRGRVKVLVFGSRYWMGTEHIKRIRYVSSGRVVPAKSRGEETNKQSTGKEPGDGE